MFFKLDTNSNNQIFAATDSGVFRTDDNGEIWIGVNSGLTDLYVETMAITENGNIFVGTYSGIFKSTNNGESWEPKNNGILHYGIQDVQINYEQNIFVGTAYGLYFSQDDGENWTNLYSTNFVNKIAISPNNTIYIVSWSPNFYHQIFKSTDFGMTWTQLEPYPDFSPFILSIFTDFNNNVYLGGCDYVILSQDNGLTWNITRWGMPDTKINDLTTNSVDHLFAGSEYLGILNDG